MASVYTAPEDIVNAALVRIGHPKRIGSLFEGSDQAKAALDIYGQTRDELLRLEDYDFSEKISAAVLSGNNAPAPWLYQYIYPTDCVRIRDMYGSAYLADTNDPLPNLYSRAIDIVNGTQTDVVNANISPATLVYTEQVTNPQLWDSGFTEALIASLARRLAMLLADINAAKGEGGDEKAMVQATGDIVG